MLPSVPNRYSILSEEDQDSEDLRIEMENLQPPDKETVKAQMSEVRDVSVGNFMACLTATMFHLEPNQRAGAKELQVSSKSTRIGETPANTDNLTPAPKKGSGLPVDEVTNLFRGGSSPLLISC